MLRSLVGSEMCIRDRLIPVRIRRVSFNDRNDNRVRHSCSGPTETFNQKKNVSILGQIALSQSELGPDCSQPIRTWARKGQPIRTWARKGQPIRTWVRKGQPIRTWDRLEKLDQIGSANQNLGQKGPANQKLGQIGSERVSQSEIGSKSTSKRWSQSGPK